MLRLGVCIAFVKPQHICGHQYNQLGIVVDPCHPNGGWVMECQALQQVLHLMWMAHPNQADSLQGLQGGNVEVLAANDPGIGSGWQQSKQNWALSAVVGKWVRVDCSDLCWRTTGVTPPACFFPLPPAYALGPHVLPAVLPHNGRV